MRRDVALGARMGLLLVALAAAAPAQSQGDGAPSSAHVLTLWRDGDPGQRLEIRGRVLDGSGRPLAGAVVEVRQAAGDGVYHPEYSGVMRTSERGEYVLRTAMPGNYGVPKHIHIAASHADGGWTDTEIRFKGDPELYVGDEHAIVLETVRLGDREILVGTFDLTLGGR